MLRICVKSFVVPILPFIKRNPDPNLRKGMDRGKIYNFEPNIFFNTSRLQTTETCSRFRESVFNPLKNSSIADSDPGSGDFLTPRSGIDFPGYRIGSKTHIFESFVTIFLSSIILCKLAQILFCKC